MTSFALKWIAIITMLIDHIGVVFVPRGTPLYYVCRAVGRAAFPLFAFMIAEGFFYTKDARRYLLRLCIFAVASEIPFDLMISGVLMDWTKQSVYVTLALAMLGLYLFDEFARRNDRVAALMTLFAAAAAAILFRSDYGAFGVLMVFVFYRFRGERLHMAVWFGVCVVLYNLTVAFSVWPAVNQVRESLLTLFELFALPPILLYNRSKGYNAKGWQYFFYVFYPSHMLVLYLLHSYLV